MNCISRKRIDELAIRAGFDIVDIHHSRLESNNPYDNFVRLIIEDCVECIRGNYDNVNAEVLSNHLELRYKLKDKDIE